MWAGRLAGGARAGGLIDAAVECGFPWTRLPSAPHATGRAREGSSRVAGIASLQCNQWFVKGTDTPGKSSEKVNSREGAIFTTRHCTTQHLCTCA